MSRLSSRYGLVRGWTVARLKSQSDGAHVREELESMSRVVETVVKVWHRRYRFERAFKTRHHLVPRIQWNLRNLF
jgi:hypothetical protein